MKTVEIAQIDEKDMEYIDAFAFIGMNKTKAKVLFTIYSLKQATQKDIEWYTNISQSIISINLKSLKELGYIKSETIHTVEKGRNANIYMLNMSMKDIVTDIKNKYKEIKIEIENMFEKLNSLE